MSDTEERIMLTFEQAESIIMEGAEVHTFRSTPGVLLGADHERKGLLERMKKNENTLELAGEGARGMGHGLVFQDGGPLFVETDEEKISGLEKSLTK